MSVMIRLLLVLLGTISTGGPRAVARPGRGTLVRPDGVPDEPGRPDDLPEQDSPARPQRPPRRGRRRLPRWLKASAAAAVAVLVFRRALASVTLTAAATALHVVGISAHLPQVSFAWPWQEVSPGTTSTTDLGPWVLQKIEGISRPALGQVNFNFVFTRKVSKNIGPLPCWYSSTFYAVGHASATVDLNPGPAWWAPTTGHFRLRVVSPPTAGKPGQVAVTMMLPRPQLPQSADDVTIDDLPSRPLSTDHSWTYPGIACGALLRPQFPESVLYAQAQRMAFYRAGHVPAITAPLIGSAEAEAAQTIKDSFIQPAVNALGYQLTSFALDWAPTSAG